MKQLVEKQTLVEHTGWTAPSEDAVRAEAKEQASNGKGNTSGNGPLLQPQGRKPARAHVLPVERTTGSEQFIPTA